MALALQQTKPTSRGSRNRRQSSQICKFVAVLLLLEWHMQSSDGDRPIVWIDVEKACGVDISIGTIFDHLGPSYLPNRRSDRGGGDYLTLEFWPNGDRQSNILD